MKTAIIGGKIRVPKDGRFDSTFDEESGCYQILTEVGLILVSVRKSEFHLSDDCLREFIKNFLDRYSDAPKQPLSCEELDDTSGYQGVKVLQNNQILIVRMIRGSVSGDWMIVSWEGSKNINIKTLMSRLRIIKFVD